GGEPDQRGAAGAVRDAGGRGGADPVRDARAVQGGAVLPRDRRTREGREAAAVPDAARGQPEAAAVCVAVPVEGGDGRGAAGGAAEADPDHEGRVDAADRRRDAGGLGRAGAGGRGGDGGVVGRRGGPAEPDA